MTIRIATVTQSTDTFGQWLAKTNQAIVAINAYAVTVNSNTAIGNAAISGKFTANTVVGNNGLYVGYGTSNIVANAAALTIQSSTTQNNILTSTGMVIGNTSYTQTIMKLGNTTIRGSNVSTNNLYLTTYANVGNTFLTRTSVYADTMNTRSFYASTNAVIGDNQANTTIDRYGVIIYSQPTGTWVVNTNITSTTVSTVDVYANNLHGNILPPPGTNTVNFYTNTHFMGTNNYFDYGLTSNGNIEIYGNAMHFSHSWNPKTANFNSSNNIFVWQGSNGAANFTRNIFEVPNGTAYISQGMGERLHINQGTLSYMTYWNGTINSSSYTNTTPFMVNNATMSVTTGNVVIGNSTFISNTFVNGWLNLVGKGAQGSKLTISNTSAGDIVFNDVDPESGIYNYTLRMDGGLFKFAFSTVNTPFNYGNDKFTVSYNGDVKVFNSLGVGLNPSGTAGQIVASDDIIAYASSDVSLKTNVKNITNALEKVNQINGVEFDWTDEHLEKNAYINKHDVGVIAQEIEKVLPEVVTTRDNGLKAVKYEKIVALLIEAVKELSAEVEELKKKN